MSKTTLRIDSINCENGAGMVQVLYTYNGAPGGRLFDSRGSIQDFVDAYLGSEEAALALMLAYSQANDAGLLKREVVGQTLTVDWTSLTSLVDVTKAVVI